MAACIFCALLRGDAPSETVYRDDDCVAFMDINPVTRGHVLVVPRAHVPDVWALEDAEAAAVMVAVRRVAALLRTGLAPDGLNLFQANGAVAFQEIFHFHMHVLPRYAGDGLVLPFQRRPGDPAEIRAAAEAIRAAA